MKIAIVTETFLPKIDGIVTMLVRTVECLRQTGHEVLIFAPGGGPGELFGAEVVSMPSVAFALYPELRLALPRTSMRRKLEQFQPDLIHVFEPVLLGIGGIYYSSELRIPLAISYHTNLPAYLAYYGLRSIEGLTWNLMRLRHRRALLNLCTSTAMLNDLKSHGIENLALWQRAVDTDLYHPGKASPEMRSRLSAGKTEAPLVLYVGRLSAEKEVARLKELFSANPEIRLAIVGDGPLRPDLERHFHGTPTLFTGYLHGEELASAYASADLFVLPSRTETLGLVLLEAMAAGCPVVACDAGGVPDAVRHNATGFLFHPEDDGPQSQDKLSLASTVSHALSSPSRLQAIRLAALEDARKHSWRAATSRLLALYAQATLPRLPGRALQQPAPLPRRLAANIARGTLRTLLG